MKRGVCIIVSAVVLLAAGATGWIGRARPLVDLRGDVRDLTATPAGVFWIEAPSPPYNGPTLAPEPGEAPRPRPPTTARLFRLAPGARQPTTLREAPDIRSLSVTDDAVYCIEEVEPKSGAGRLVAIPLTGAGARAVREGLAYPQGLYAQGRTVYWTECRPARAEKIVHVPVMRPLNVIRSGNVSGGEARSLALAEGTRGHFEGSLLGLRQGKLYWAEQIGVDFSPGFMLVKREGEREPELLGREKGVNAAALDGDLAWWTGCSEELAEPLDGRCARRMDLNTRQSDTVTDFLPTRGALIARGGRAWLSGLGLLWLIPSRPAFPTPVLKTMGGGPGQVAIFHGNLYAAEYWRGKHKLVRRPLSWLGYLRAALHSGRAA